MKKNEIKIRVANIKAMLHAQNLLIEQARKALVSASSMPGPGTLPSHAKPFPELSFKNGEFGV
jgi:hypothetical protein